MWGEDDASSRIMTEVAKRLSDDEIKAVANYLQGLHAAE
jgi:cytochrome c553